MALSSATHSHATSTHPPDCRLPSHDDGQVRSSHTRGFKHSDDGSFSSISVCVNINLFRSIIHKLICKDVKLSICCCFAFPIEHRNIVMNSNKSLSILKTFDFHRELYKRHLEKLHISGKHTDRRHKRRIVKTCYGVLGV